MIKRAYIVVATLLLGACSSGLNPCLSPEIGRCDSTGQVDSGNEVR